MHQCRPRGCKTVLVTGHGRLPHLDVVNTQAPALSERIYAQSGLFWWPWAQAIAPATHPAAAAHAIAHALAISPRDEGTTHP